MKKICFVSLMVIMIFSGSSTFSQINPGSSDYQRLKEQGMIDQPEQVPAPSPAIAILPEESGARSHELHVPLDGTFTNITSTYGSCDDCSYGPFALPFTFCFYGTNYTSFYLNTNGNVSFEGPYGSFTSTGFPVSDFGMLAPFWADVVTWDCGAGFLGEIFMKIEPTRVTVIWDSVGYYGCGGDKKNTFELIFTDGNDPIIGITNNVAFSFADMEWTTGEASGGVGGLGGTPATVGVNKGDNVKYALVGRFDHEGTDFDGAGGAADGVSYLDGKYYAFDACEEDVVIPTDVPVSDWALGLGILLILAFAVVRFRRFV